MRPELRTKKQLGETIILEQLLQIFPPDIRTGVREHEPEDGMTAGKLAMQYLNARKGAPSRPIRVQTRDYNCPRDIVSSTFEGNRGVNGKGHTAQYFTRTLIVSSRDIRHLYAL